MHLSVLLVFLLLLATLVVGDDLCLGVDCGQHALCNPHTGVCECQSGYTGEFCNKLDCGPHGMARKGSQHCWCRMGWMGDKCDTCAVPGPGYKFVCVATSRHTGHPYALAYVNDHQYHEIMTGRLQLDMEADHRSIAPRSRGFDNRFYDCECRPVVDIPPSRRRGHNHKRSLNETQAETYETVVDQCITDAMFDAETTTIFNAFTDQCLSSRHQVNGWMIAAILLAVLSAVLLILMIYYCARVSQSEREAATLRKQFTVQNGPAAMEALTANDEMAWLLGRDDRKKV